jgi:hypothetical protein
MWNSKLCVKLSQFLRVLSCIFAQHMKFRSFFFLDSILDIICHIYEIHCRNLENLLSIEGMLSKILKILSCILAQGMNFRSLPFILF